jgi:hypothetical protein
MKEGLLSGDTSKKSFSECEPSDDKDQGELKLKPYDEEIAEPDQDKGDGLTSLKTNRRKAVIMIMISIPLSFVPIALVRILVNEMMVVPMDLLLIKAVLGAALLSCSMKARKVKW